MTKQQFDAQLEAQLAELPKAQMPQRDLWPGIELALAREEQHDDARSSAGDNRRTVVWASLAASVAVVGLVGVLSLRSPAPQLDGMQLVNALSAQHEQQKNALLVKFQDQPALTQNWQQQLDELDSASEAIKAALDQDPDNMALLKMLQKVHQQQIDLIERVHSPKWQQI
ncbi:hypothetical protein LJ739_15680 [Aestuariibacter halophilus]|uniref:Anti-sigma factor n=1 Tax=Fluctibacter halophilus TaxID=226011 RepID=A0ABS8GAS8_9ALTE|nr:hypothetical protein [Aestuariibacter halophilus]MCC2617692.1 hypothetical protein [Aestuariibacter halophilus]